MKHKFILLFITFICLNFSFAQKSKSIELGGSVGANITELYEPSGGSTDPIISYNVNVFGEYYLSKNWGVKVKLFYDKKGCDDGIIMFDNDGINHKTKFKFDYLTLPIMANWHFGPQKRWYVNLGPYVGVLLSAKDTKFNTDMKEIINNFDAGIALGAGFKKKLTKQLRLFAEVDVQNGFVNIFKESPDSYLKAEKNRRLAFNVGLLYQL